jgi:hypothetical protein
VPGVLQRHLEHRDRTLAALIPAAVARACVALPIGRTRNQELIVCVRDPRPELPGILARVIAGPIVIAVAPASQLEELIRDTYGGEHRWTPGSDEADDVEVDLSTRPIPVIDDPLSQLGSMTLVGLDDVRVAKDPSQSGQHAAILPRTMTGLPRTATGPRSAPTLVTALAELDHAATADDASDAAMRFLAGRFRHAVLFTINEGAALGDRGHGEPLTTELIQAITVPLSAPSILQVAHETRRLTTTAPPGADARQPPRAGRRADRARWPGRARDRRGRPDGRADRRGPRARAARARAGRRVRTHRPTRTATRTAPRTARVKMPRG